MEKFLWIVLGGGLGSGARYLLSSWTSERLGNGFPWGTLAVNVLGSAALAFLLEIGSGASQISPTLRLALTTGFLGGFTTYSTFNQDTLGAWQRGETGLAALIVLVTLGACLLSALAGQALARVLASP